MVSVQEKWDRIYSGKAIHSSEPSIVLSENQHLLPKQGVALDLACGLGANSLLLAQAGLEVLSWDISTVAVQTLQQQADEQGLFIQTQVRDVEALPLLPASVDVLVVSYFLSRNIAQALMTALKPGGLLFYQTYTQQKVGQQGPSNPAYLLADNELLEMFSALKVRVYREEALLGRVDLGWRNQAMLVAQR